MPPMKLWIEDKSTPTHHIVYINREGRNGLDFLGDLDDDAIRSYFGTLSSSIDVEKNLKLLHYFGYLHLFAKKEQP